MVTVVADSAEDGRIYNGGGSSGGGQTCLECGCGPNKMRPPIAR
jgi:hypothetical protein